MRGKSARASPTPRHTLNEERSARFTAQHLSPLAGPNRAASEAKTPNSTQSVALYDTGAAGDSYGAPLKCRT